MAGVENHSEPIVRVRVSESEGWLPMAGVPELGSIADSCDGMARRLAKHAHHIRFLSQAQPQFYEEAGEPEGFDGEDIGLPEDDY